MPKKSHLPPTGTASWREKNKGFCPKFCDRKIEWMAGTWKPRKPRHSVQIKIKKDQKKFKRSKKLKKLKRSKKSKR